MSASSSEPKDSIPVPEDSIPRLPSDSNNELSSRYNPLNFKNVANKVEVKEKDVGNKLGGNKGDSKLGAGSACNFDNDVIANPSVTIATDM